jgi:branched-chain amino acid transport system permease protein
MASALGFILTVANLSLIYVVLALGLNLHFGYTGLLNFGHVAFFAAGAYTAGLLTLPPPGTVEQTTVSYTIGLGLPMPIGLPISLLGGAFVGGILAFLIGITSVRLRSHYLAVATFALASLFIEFVTNEQWLTRGPFGLNEIPRPGTSILEGVAWELGYFLFLVVLVVLVYFFIYRLVDAPFGRLLKGIREDETPARVLGKETNWAKLKSFAIGGAIAGMAGAAYAHYIGSIVPSQFTVLVTIFVWVAVILGGTGSNKGMILGAIVFIAFRESTRFLPEIQGYPFLMTNLRWVAIGLMLVVVLRLRPQGLLGEPGEIVALEEE